VARSISTSAGRNWSQALNFDLLQIYRCWSGSLKRMRKNRSALVRGRHFEDEIIILCLRWYLRYSLSYRDLEEMMAERGLSLDHSTIWRWVQRYAPILNQRIRRELRRRNGSWRVDEAYIRVAGKWTYLY
jgi:transposase, IS6 family